MYANKLTSFEWKFISLYTYTKWLDNVAIHYHAWAGAKTGLAVDKPRAIIKAFKLKLVHFWGR
jgi:hypothetical protein